MLNYIMLALSVSIDSLGIGFTYGLKQTKINLSAKLILFLISFAITSLSVLLGNFLSLFLSPNISKLFGSFILIFIGILIIYQVFNIPKEKKKKTYNLFLKSLGITIKIIHDPIYSDLDSSNNIDSKESVFLGIALSLDSLGVGIGGSILGTSSLLFPFLVSLFQFIFLNFGAILGKNFSSKVKFSSNIWNVISGVLLILIGLFKVFIK